MVLLVAIGATAMMSSAAPFQPVRAMQPGPMPGAAPVLDPGADTLDLNAVRLRALATPTPTPSPAPMPTSSPTPKPVPAIARPAPPPLLPPAVQAQEIALVNLDNGRFLWQSNTRQA